MEDPLQLELEQSVVTIQAQMQKAEKKKFLNLKMDYKFLK